MSAFDEVFYCLGAHFNTTDGEDRASRPSSSCQLITLSTKTEECISRFEQNLEFKKTDSPIFVQIGFFDHFHELKFGQFSVSKIIHHDA